MAVAALIKFVQGLSTPPAGEALLGVLTTLVTASNDNNSGPVINWRWTMIDAPPGSAITPGVLSDGAVPTFSFSPDVRGGYHLELVVTDAAGNQSRDRRVFQVAEESGRIVPPFSADARALNFGGETRGWSPIMESWLRYEDGTVLANGSTGTLDDVVSTVSGFTISTIRFGGAAPTVNGIASGYSARALLVIAAGGNLVLANEAGASTAANRITTGTGANVTVSQGAAALLVYDATTLRWRVLTAGSGGGGGTDPGVIFDDNTAKVNIRSDRTGIQSPINNTDTGITNLGSRSVGATTGVTGDYSTIGGGDQNQVSGNGSTITGGILGTITCDFGSIGGGNSCSIGNGSHYGVVAGGRDNLINATSAHSAIGGGRGNLILTGSEYATIPGGRDNQVDASYAVAFGKEAWAPRAGQVSHAVGSFSTIGDAQVSRLVRRGQTSDATPTAIEAENGDDFILDNDYAYAMTVKVIAHRTNGAGRAMWIFDLLLHCTAGVAVIDNSNTTLSVPNGQAWTVGFSISGNALVTEFTGSVGHDINIVVAYDWTESGG